MASSSKKLASRRFIFTCTALLCATLIMYSGLLDGDSYTQIIIWLTGIYVMGKPFGDVAGLLISRAFPNGVDPDSPKAKS